MGTPSTYSMTRYGRPSPVAPPSRMRAMLGCSRLARIWRNSWMAAWRSAAERSTRTSNHCRSSMAPDPVYTCRMGSTPSSVTGLLHAWQEGDRDAGNSLMVLLYDELRRLAAHYMRDER